MVIDAFVLKSLSAAKLQNDVSLFAMLQYMSYFVFFEKLVKVIS